MMLVQLLIGYYVVANALKVHDSIVIGMLLLGLFEAAYLAEIFRGALESISQSQREAAEQRGGHENAADPIQTNHQNPITCALKTGVNASSQRR